jgi:hypothetical protein
MEQLNCINSSRPLLIINTDVKYLQGTQAAASQIDRLKGESNDKIRKLTDWHIPQDIEGGKWKN